MKLCPPLHHLQNIKFQFPPQHKNQETINQKTPKEQHMRTLKSTTTTSTSTAMEVDSGSEPPTAMQRSPWHSPVPYLFGGLAAMLGLIAFALLILACSYWKLSGQLNGDNNNGDDLENGGDEKKCKDGKGKGRDVYEEEQFVVIMAGDHRPTCLAMPVVCSNRSSSSAAAAMLFNLSNESDGEKTAPTAAAADGSVQVNMESEEEGDGHQRRSDEVAECNSMNSEVLQSHSLHLDQHQTHLVTAESSS